MGSIGSTSIKGVVEYKPPYVVIDFETELDGRGSTEYWKPNFRVTSMALSYFDESGEIRSKYVEGEAACRTQLERICRQKIPIIAHNAQFEMGVVACRFPDLGSEIVWLSDTMRLVQVYDNGGDEFALEVPPSLDEQLDALLLEEDGENPQAVSLAGLGLVKACQRILRRPDHKEKAYKWIRENVPEAKGKREGGFLNRLPADLLREYNIADTEATLELYKFITDYFVGISYNWRIDHFLYFSSVRRIVNAQIRGVAVARERLSKYREAVQSEIDSIAAEFHERFADPITVVERKRLLDEVRKRKTLRGRKQFVRRTRSDVDYFADKCGFNVGSNKQLASLFVDSLGIKPRFVTDKGQPSFRSAVLSQWGDGGEMLKTRRKRLLVLKQCDALLELSAHDGRWHHSLKCCGTATGRFAGGSAQ